jgi:hypothetical protein
MANVTTSVDIIKEALAKDGLDRSKVENFIVDLAKGIQAKTLQIVQIYKTVFVISTIKEDGAALPKGTVNAFPLTIEPDQLPNRLKTLPSTLKHMKFQTLRLPTDDESDAELAKKLFPKAKVSQEAGKNGATVHVIEMRL